MSVGGGGEAGGVTGFFLFTGAVGGGGSIHKFLQGQMNTFPRSGRLYGCDLLDLAHVRQASCQDEVFGSLLLEATFISKTKHYQPLVSLQPRWLKRLSWRPLIFPFVVAGAVRASQRFFVIRPDPVGHVSTVFELACMSNVPSARRRQFDVCLRLLCCFRHEVDLPNAEMSSEVVGNVRCAWKGQTFASCDFFPVLQKPPQQSSDHFQLVQPRTDAELLHGFLKGDTGLHLPAEGGSSQNLLPALHDQMNARIAETKKAYRRR